MIFESFLFYHCLYYFCSLSQYGYISSCIIDKNKALCNNMQPHIYRYDNCFHFQFLKFSEINKLVTKCSPFEA